MLPSQLRMARAALKIGVRELAELADVTTATITRFENERGGLNALTSNKIKVALEDVGVVFLTAGGSSVGPGICLRQSSWVKTNDAEAAQ